MVVVAVVSGTTRSDRVLIEAARQADDRKTEVHVLYVLGLGWYANLEMSLGERFGLPTRADAMREMCERKATRIAKPVIDDYEAAGRVGRPIEEIDRYVREVGGDCVVIDAEANWGAGFKSLYRDPPKQLRESGISVVPVY